MIEKLSKDVERANNFSSSIQIDVIILFEINKKIKLHQKLVSNCVKRYFQQLFCTYTQMSRGLPNIFVSHFTASKRNELIWIWQTSQGKKYRNVTTSLQRLSAVSLHSHGTRDYSKSKFFDGVVNVRKHSSPPPPATCKKRNSNA